MLLKTLAICLLMCFCQNFIFVFTEVCIGSREMLQVCLKASMLQKEKVSNCDVTFTDLTLHDGKVSSQIKKV
jgi:hypothetical protein